MLHLAVILTAIAVTVRGSAFDKSVPPFNNTASLSPVKPAYPLKASANNRYLIDQDNVSFLMIGDAPQTLIANLSQAEAAAYMANRRTYSINTLWIDLLCNFSDGCNKDATTFDGIAPFTVAEDLSTPNPAYFQRADEMINLAANNGMVVLLNPIETSRWLDILRTNGTAKAFAYGQYLGNRYKGFPNIIWMHGNHFQSWRNAADDALVQAVARGIKSIDSIRPTLNCSPNTIAWISSLSLWSRLTMSLSITSTTTAVRQKICDTRNTGQCLAARPDMSTEALIRGGLKRDGRRIWTHRA
jgi:hypothetical protein